MPLEHSIHFVNRYISIHTNTSKTSIRPCIRYIHPENRLKHKTKSRQKEQTERTDTRVANEMKYYNHHVIILPELNPQW